MAEVSISPADCDCLDRFAEVMVDAFATEGINTYTFDFGRGFTRACRCRTAKVELDAFISDGDHVLVARETGVVVGGAIISRNSSRRLGARLVHVLGWLYAAWPLVLAVRWRRVLSAHRATMLSRPIAGTYYTLAALAIHPACQRRGIGAALLEEVHKLSERDASVLGVYLYTADTRNQLMYHRAGYETIETRRAGDLSVYHMFRTNGGGFLRYDINP